jgi:lysozyme
MKTSPRAIALLKEHEGLRLTAYLCPANVWTIGWGHTRRVYPGQRITEEEAEAMLAADLIEAERCVRMNVSVPLNQNQFDALVSFVFNLGCPALRRSTLLRHLNAGDHDKASQQFPRWVHGGGRKLPGLVRRRAAEKNLFREVPT